jgi:hypothetical protein
MPLRDIFRDLFRDPAAERELGLLGRHVTVPTFNLSTTSLRHINRWYDRLQDIADGGHRGHPNFYSDPESPGLIQRVSNRGRLTKAGCLFLATAPACRNSPARAEFELIKILYYSGLPHRTAVDEFLDGKRQNLLRFLTDCHLSSNSEALLRSPNLLAIAEALARFSGALHRFLELQSEDLSALGALGEAGFKKLWSDTQPPAGLGRLARKIGADYTRAEDRRLHFLVAMVLNEIRQDLVRGGRLFDELRVPQPFSNLVTAKYLLAVHAAYTDEIRVADEEGRILVFLDPQVVASPAAPIITQIGIRVPMRHAGRRGAKKPKVRQPVARRRVIDAVLAKEAEDYIERTILKSKHGRALVRVGHTDREFVLLPDGAIPGADFYVTGKNHKKCIRFCEAKSALHSPPASIRITRGEYARARKCHTAGIPYEIYVVVFLDGATAPKVLHIPDFAAKAAGLTLDHVVSFDLALDL